MLRVRQVALITADLDKTYKLFSAVFGIAAGYEDAAVAEFGLRNVILTLGDTFIELLAPAKPDTAASRFLSGRSEGGGYMLILQTDNIAEMDRRVQEQGIRKTWAKTTENASVFHMHPKDTGGPILSFDEMKPVDSWAWAGPDWGRRAAKFVGAITGVEVDSSSPARLAKRWTRLFGRDLVNEGNDWSIPLDKGSIRIRRSEGSNKSEIAAIQVEVYDRESVFAAVTEHGIPISRAGFVLCGVEFRLGSMDPTNLGDQPSTTRAVSATHRGASRKVAALSTGNAPSRLRR